MDRLKQLKTYPFGLFLWVEWILLVSALFVDLPVSFLFAKYYNYNINTSIWVGSTLSLISLIALGVIGLKFPNKKLYKWLYLCLQVGLIWLPTIYNHKIDLSLFLYLVVALRNGLIFKPKECKLANIFLFLSFVPSLIFIENYQDFQATVLSYQTITNKDYQLMSSTEMVLNLMLFALCIILFWMLVDVSLREYQSQQQLAHARQQLRQYAIQAEERATVHERNRIAREIHDSVGHALTAQTIQLNNVIAFWQVDKNKAYQFVIEAKKLTATALKEIRSSVSTLRSDPLEGNLEKAIALLFQEFSSRTQIVPQHTIVLDCYLTEEIKLTVYRIVQEALTNIAKHSKAQNVKVNLQTFSEHLHLSIEDDGKGFDPELNTTGFGLQGMQERITSLDGKLEIDSINSGCKIAIRIPYQTLLIDD